ncbi:TetR/AcrR family transcriptional regulator [Nocardioides sp. SLBN-35]|jgi:AcrR family transcriptional regulator|uniref:TetR/AcrR family transcriptional regulator n=1 Tax=Nocardioides sp. SLBN-35 TaxID=2768445 RepID=UPI001150B09E|nr:TetR/AcrR family transcriptional regulator [Nocardioides sp. SLBN-35]
MSSERMPRTSVAKKTRRPRDSLSRDVILEAAEVIAVRDGLDGLTFAALGKELHAHATSIYRHFRDKDELVLELIDVLRAKSYETPLVSSGDWREDLRFTARAIHANYLRYPSLAQQMAVRTTRRPTEFRNVEFALDALHRAGLDDDSAVSMLRVFGNFVRAASAIEAAVHALPSSVRATDELAWEMEYRQLPAEEFPNINRLSDRLLGVGDPQVFEDSLELILDVIELRGQEQRTARAAAG